MSDDIQLREFSEGDLPGTLDLLRISLGESAVLQRTTDLFRWKHFDNPFGSSIVRIAEFRGKIIGVRVFMRWELFTKQGQRLRCVRPVDTATHPQFRRRGILRQLTAEALEIARRDEVDLVFNTPNNLAHAADIAMGWRDVGPIGVMVHPTLRILRHQARDQLPDTEKVIQGGVPVAELVYEDRPAEGMRTPRSQAYIDWRYSHPTAPYRLIYAGTSAAVVRANRRRGIDEVIISDVFGPSPKEAMRAVRRRSRSGYVVAWFSRGSPEWWGAVQAGIIPLPGITALRLVTLPLVELPFDATESRNWDLALSDLELL